MQPHTDHPASPPNPDISKTPQTSDTLSMADVLAPSAAPTPAPSSTPTSAPQEPLVPSASQDSISVPAKTLEALNALLHQQAKSQKSNRLRRNIWLGLIVGLVALTILWPMLRGSSNASATQKHVALIKLEGTIEIGSAAAAEPMMSALQAAFEDSASVAVVMQMNSPGGSPVQSAMIYDEINRLRSKYNKPLYAVVEEICASGCYYVAAAADDIYVNPASMVGSIGVLMDGFGAAELIKKLGVERRLYAAGENKGMLDPFSPSNPKHNAMIQEMLVSVHDAFIKAVREGRGDRLKETADMFSGRIFTGQGALSNGLADEVGTVSSLARDVIEVGNIVDYSPKENIAERVAKKLGASFGGAFGASAARSLLQSHTQLNGVLK